MQFRFVNAMKNSLLKNAEHALHSDSLKIVKYWASGMYFIANV